jgi:hypothetical protein
MTRASSWICLDRRITAWVDRSYTKRYNVATSRTRGIFLHVEGARLDRSYRIYPGGFTTQFHELEYFVRSEDGLAAVEAIQHLIRTKYPEQKYPVEVRWVKADDAYMSQFQGRDSTVITLTTEPGTDYWQFFRDADAVLQEFEPRAHWGKIHFMTRSRLERLYPDWTPSSRSVGSSIPAACSSTTTHGPCWRDVREDC